MKYLLVIAVVLIAFYIWRNNRIGSRSEAARQTPPPPARPQVPAIMVACRQCGTHLPQTEAVLGRDGGVYCSVEHQRRSESGAA